MYDSMYEKPDPEKDSKPQFTWSCPYDGCKKYIATWTENGMRILREKHLTAHRKQDKADGTLAGALAKLRQKDLNKLDVTLIDIGFLKTRGIKIDENIILDFSIEERPSKTELSQRQWAEILERIWSRSSTYGTKERT